MSEARDFDGTNDKLDFGTDASIDGFATITVSLWYRRDLTDAQHTLFEKLANIEVSLDNDVNLNGAKFVRAWSGGNALWATGTFANDTVRHHFVMTYDGGAAANDPIFYKDGSSVALSDDINSTGTLNSDAAGSALVGETAAGNGDLDGRIEYFSYDNTVWTAAEVNRARWWGRPKGGIQVYHPLLTDKLTNEGAATANGTATGTTVAAMVTPVVIPGTATMGMGVGW